MSVWSCTVESIKLFRLLGLLLHVLLKPAPVLIVVSRATCASIFHTTLVGGVASPFNQRLCDQEVTRVLLHPRGYRLTSAELWRGTHQGLAELKGVSSVRQSLCGAKLTFHLCAEIFKHLHKQSKIFKMSLFWEDWSQSICLILAFFLFWKFMFWCCTLWCFDSQSQSQKVAHSKGTFKTKK